MNNFDTSSPSRPQQDLTPPAKRRRHRWLWLVVLLVLVLAVLGYALLPWLIPTDWLRSRIVAGIEEQFGRSASISSIEISWSDGIIVRDIAIDRLEQFGPGPFFKASRLQLDFRPLSLLLRHRLGSVRVDQPQFWIVADAAGRLNLTSLPRLDAEEDAFDQITVTNANLHFIDQIHGRETQLAIPQINVARDVRSGQYSFLAQGAPSKTTGQPLFSLRVNFTPPGSGSDLQDIPVRGSAELLWSDFDLATVPLPRLSKVDCQVLGGTTSGRARLELYSEGRVELLECTAELDKLRLQVAQVSDKATQQLSPPAQIHIPQARFKLHGSYEFVSGELTIKTLSGTLAGLDFSSSLQGRFFPAERTFAPSAVSLAATVQLSRLREQFPFLDRLLREHDLTVTGSSSLKLDFEQTEKIDRLSFSIDALDTGLHSPALLHKSAGLPCGIKLSALIDHNTASLALDEPLEIELASGRFSLDMQLAQPLRMASFLDLFARPREIVEQARRQWPQAQIDTTLEIGQVGDLVAIFPTLAGVLSGNGFTLAGPIHAELHLQPVPTDAPDSPSQLNADVSLPAQSSLELPPYFRKPPGESLSFSFAARLPAGSSRLDEMQISCKLGQATLSVTDASCAIELSPGAWPDFTVSLSTAGQFHLENSAALSQALPALQELGLAGNVTGRFDLGFDPPTSLRLALSLDAGDLALRVPANLNTAAGDHSEPAVLFQKAALTPAKLDLQFWLDMPPDNNRQAKPISWFELFSADNVAAAAYQAKLSWELGDSLGSIEIDQPGAQAKDGLAFGLTFSKIDLHGLDENFPFLAPVFEHYQLAGSASLKLGGRLSRELLLESLDFYGDFTAAQFIVPAKTSESGEPNPAVIMRKSAQLPLTLQAYLRVEDYDEQGWGRIKLESAQLSFAGSQLNLAAGSLLAGVGEGRSELKAASPEYSFMQSLLRFDRFASAQFDADGQVVFNQELVSLFPILEQIHRRMPLSGLLNYQLQFTAEPGQAALTAKLSSPPNGMKVGPAEFAKAEHHLQVFFDPDTEGLAVAGASLKLPLLELSLFDESLRLSGELSVSQDQLDVPDLSISVGDSSGYFTAHLENISTAPAGYVSFYSPLIDQPRLEDFAAKLSSFVQQQIGGQSWAPDDQASSAADESPAHEQAVDVRRLGPMDISFRAKCDELLLSLPDGSAKFNLQQIDFDSQLTSASLTGRFGMAVNGGRLGGELSILFDEPGLPLSCRYEALELMAEENLLPLVSQVFPDMTVKGTISESRSITTYILGGKDLPQFPEEQGVTILREGMIVGPSAPRWVIYWFPKLSLTEYPFEVAHNVFSRNPKDGRMINDMVFVGKDRYNIYITGVTMSDNTTNYTLGVDMSPGFVSLEQRHIWRQSRVPLLTYTGQIVDHKWASQTVRNTWPTRVAWDMFIKNNALRTLIEQRRQTE
ncbi:MAG: hypothetical protein KAT11_00515 [Phycisphaerae bacterium]|nr:hypothetical protein [Phycisphaerae bacterium]